VRKEIIPNGETLSAQVLDSALKINSIPMDDCRGDETQTGRPEALILKRAVTDLALAVEENGLVGESYWPRLC
jgi:hypothetical protein